MKRSILKYATDNRNILIRCFVALELKDDAMKAIIKRIQNTISGSGADLKLVEPQNFHFTLRFLGEIPESKVERVKELLSKVKHEPFEATLKGVGVFPSLRRINVIWIGVSEGQESIRKLFLKVNNALSPLFPKEREDFVPHLTIARVRTGRNKERLAKAVQALAEVDVGRVKFEEFQFKKSTLTPKGPIYEDLKVYKLE